MPTFRKDIHLGHDVAQIDTDDIVDGAINEEKMADDSVSTRALQDRCVTEPKLADDAVSTRTIQDKAVTEPKLADGSVSHRTIQPNAVDRSNIKPGSICTQHLEDGAVTTPKIKDKSITAEKLGCDIQKELIIPPLHLFDQKYQTITDELYSMIESLQVGGIALSQKMGDREDIGISQKALTDLLLRIWKKIGEMTGESYEGFTLTVTPKYIANEGTATVEVLADSTMGISNFDSIKIYANEELKDEAIAVDKLFSSFEIKGDTIIKCIAVIAGRTYTKQETIRKYIPFFMGSGQQYTDIMREECRKRLDGTLEGDYDVMVQREGDHIFIIIPISRKDEFRRADMNGYEIPVESTVTNELVVYKSINTYMPGVYNIDIDINT